MTTNINNSPKYACRTCMKQQCGCKDTESALPCHFYTEQPKQEPVGYFAYDEEHNIWEELTRPDAPGATPLYAAPVQQAEQEPVAIIEKEAGFETEVYATGHAASLPDGVFKLYAAPQPTQKVTESATKREAGLTGQDLCDLEVAVGWKGDSHEFEAIVKAAIAKYKEKNRG